MIRVLFVDTDNGARSQMAEAFLTKIGKRHCIPFSAGIRKGYQNEYAGDVMKEAGLDISRYSTKEVMSFIKTGFSFQYVILVCNEKELDEVVLLPPAGVRLYWVFEDPSRFEGTDKEITDFH